MNSIESTHTPNRIDMLRASNISVEFEGLTALSDVDISLRDNEILGLIGPNGAGKTTLVNVLSGFQKPSQGSVSLRDRDVTHLGAPARARLGIGRTFQAGRLFEDLTVLENIEVGALGMRVSRRLARKTAIEILELMGLGLICDRKAAGLPHGLERLVGIARALATGAPVILLDEPAAGLNESESERFIDLLQKVRTTHLRSMILIEHDMSIVMRLCDRIHVLNYGKTIAVGEPDSIKKNPKVLEAYLGTASKLKGS